MLMFLKVKFLHLTGSQAPDFQFSGIHLIDLHNHSIGPVSSFKTLYLIGFDMIL
jgi:hypothetical protein